MNNTELEALIRAILHERLAPATEREHGIFADVDAAIAAAQHAFLRYQQCPLKTRSAIIAALRAELEPHLPTLAAESVAETGMGNQRDKLLKNEAALTNTPGIEDLTTTALTGDEERKEGNRRRGRQSPPCIVDESADWVKAAEDIVNGAAFDYNLPCIAEKSLIVVAAIAESLIQQMQRVGAQLLTPADTDRLRAVCLPGRQANKSLVGKSPETLLRAAGLAVPDKAPRLLLAEVTADDPWVTCEQLMPLLPLVRVADFNQALTLALKVEAGLHHTAIMHSQNVSRLNLAARLLQTSIFVKNGPSYAGIGVGGEGFTTFTIATPTGEGTTSARTFARSRRCVLTNGFSIR